MKIINFEMESIQVEKIQLEVKSLYTKRILVTIRLIIDRLLRHIARNVESTGES